MPCFPLQPGSACSSKDTAQPTCLQVHFILISNDLILAPVLCSASSYTFSAAQLIKLGIWFTWEKNALCSLFILQLDQFPNVVHWMDTEILLLA